MRLHSHGPQVRFRHGHPDAVGEALAQRARRCLDARRNAALGMTRRHAAPPAKSLDAFQRKIVAGAARSPGESCCANTVLPSRMWALARSPFSKIEHRRRADKDAAPCDQPGSV
jgi:hypothetical protein